MATNIEIRQLGLVNYNETCLAMQTYTAERTDTTPDQIWCVEHPPVFTQGRHGKPEHIINPHNVPVVQTDRGGQVTYHGPGQAVIYFLIDLSRQKTGIKDLVCHIEESVIKLMQSYGLKAHLIESAPGVYIDNKKIASLGLRVKHGKTYHGLSINVDMNLTPFSYINPCGYQGLQMCQLSEFVERITLQDVFNRFTKIHLN
jgi:lipoyl(octanoyl) transferase